MAIHERAINAVKHGALSMDIGHIDISCEAHDRSNENEFRVRWREGRAPSRDSRPGGASVRSFSRNRYHVFARTIRANRSVPME